MINDSAMVAARRWMRVAPPLFLLAVSACTSDGFQADADIHRLRHLEYYVELIEEFRAETGRLPLQGTESGWLVVYISTESQLDHVGPGPNYEHTRASFAEWIQDVETGLGREIDEFYEPQKGVYRKPLAYVYRVIDDAYYLSVPLHHDFEFATEMGPDYFEVVVSNYAAPTNDALDPVTLFASHAFQDAISASVSRRGVFDSRAQEFRRHTKERPVPERRRVASREEQLGPLEVVCANEPPSASPDMYRASPEALTVSEYWLLLSPGDGNFIFREYDLQAVSMRAAGVSGSRVADLVEEGRYLASEYGFERFQTMRSSVYPDRGFVTTAHLLMSPERQLDSLVDDSFARVLRRPVSVTISEGSVGLRFEAEGLRVASNNSQGVFGVGEDLVVCFRNGASRYEMVVTSVTPSAGHSLASGVSDTVVFEAEGMSNPGGD